VREPGTLTLTGRGDQPARWRTEFAYRWSPGLTWVLTLSPTERNAQVQVSIANEVQRTWSNSRASCCSIGPAATCWRSATSSRSLLAA